MQMKQIEKVNWVCKKIQTQLIGYARLKKPQMRSSLPGALGTALKFKSIVSMATSASIYSLQISTSHS
jgi:hypothetical protein